MGGPTRNQAGVVIHEIGRVPPEVPIFRRPSGAPVFDPTPGDGGEDPGAPPEEEVVNTQLRSFGVWTTLLTKPDASAGSIAAADLLATELGRISGETPAREAGTQTTGVRVGLADEWGATFPEPWDWAIGNTASGVAYVYGRTPRGLQVAVRRVLHLLGYRMLTTIWEIIPVLAESIDHPQEIGDLKLRFMSGLGLTLLYPANGQEGQARLDVWQDRNGIFDDGGWPAGHAWVQIKNQFPTEFTAHPEWIAGDGEGNKLCVFMPGLVDIAVDYVEAKITSKPTLTSIALAAADGSLGWASACDNNEQIDHRPSDRQLYLANQVQLVISETHDEERHIAIQCYGDASFPSPTLDIDPNLLVIWTSAFIFGGLSPEQAIQAYIDLGCELHAPYGYFSVWPWDLDLPCKARATKRSELQKEADRLSGLSIPATGSAGESTAAWVPFGRWYWSLAGLLFGESPTSRWDAWPGLVFPNAPEQAEAWFAIVDTPVPFSSDLLHRMAQTAKDLILALTPATAEYERALDLARWTIYCNYYKLYAANPLATTLEPLLQWCFRFRHRDVTAYAAPYLQNTWLADRKAVAALHSLSDLTYASNVWADTATTGTEILVLLTTMISTNALIPFATKGFSLDLHRITGQVTITTRGTFVEETKSAIGDQAWWYHSTTGADIFTFRGGVVFQNKGPDHVKITDWATGEIVWDEDIPEDRVTRDTSGVQSFYPQVITIAQRVYRIEITAKGGLTWSWQAGTGVTLVPSKDLNLFTGSHSWKFYVPSGTTVVGFYGAGSIKFVGPDAVQIGDIITATNNYYTVAVPEGMDGSIWKVSGINGPFELLTVPPEMAQDEDELMLPIEVIEADGLSLADSIPISVPDYIPVDFTNNLVPHAVNLTGTTNGSFGYLNHTGTVGYFWAQDVTQAFTCQGGIVSAVRGNSVFRVTDMTNSTTQTFTVTNQDKTLVDYIVNVTAGGLYKLELITLGGSVDIFWDPSTLFSFVALGQNTLTAVFNTTILRGWVYVPKGTARVGWWGQAGTVKWYDNAAKLITTVTHASDYHSFPVPIGKDGTCMRFDGFSGRFEMQTVPSFWALKPSQLLIPPEVVAADLL